MGLGKHGQRTWNESRRSRALLDRLPFQDIALGHGLSAVSFSLVVEEQGCSIGRHGEGHKLPTPLALRAKGHAATVGSPSWVHVVPFGIA